jgi:hypothetical protein
MNALSLNAWGPIAGQIISAGAPILGGALGGPLGGMAGNLIGGILGQALGVPATPESVSNAITTDPTAPAKIAAAEAVHGPAISALQLQLEDVANARTQTVDLAKASSDIAYGAPVVSIIVTLGFFSLLGVVVMHGITDSPVLQVLLGTVTASFTQVANYWLGSSHGSQAKDATISAAVGGTARRF